MPTTLEVYNGESTPTHTASIQNYILDDGETHLMGISYELGTPTETARFRPVGNQGRWISIYLDSEINSLLLRKAVTISADKFYATFESAAPDSSLKRQTLPASNEFRLYWINIDIEKYSPNSDDNIPQNYTGMIIGIIVAGLAVIAFIAIALIIFRNQNRTVELLPTEIIKHYLHYSRFPLSWEVKGEDASISYIRRLNTASKGYQKNESTVVYDGWK